MNLKLNTRASGAVTVVDCAGRIVFGDETSFLREKVKDLLKDKRQIVLNLGEVTYIDSSGLGTLVGLKASADNAGATIKLANLTKRVRDLLQITKLIVIFDHFDTEAEAVDSFHKHAMA